VLVRDAEAGEKLVETALELIQDKARLEKLHENVLQLAEPDSAKRIAEEVIRLARG
jgi:UDP-N-acetylglucosamine--N-acetylmuramyl-(pentapeptide) pyrophosphoryl-undecaprenol N-acetylglucosamine transferase